MTLLPRLNSSFKNRFTFSILLLEWMFFSFFSILKTLWSNDPNHKWPCPKLSLKSKVNRADWKPVKGGPAVYRQGDSEATRSRWGTRTNMPASQEEIKAACPTSQQCEPLTSSGSTRSTASCRERPWHGCRPTWFCASLETDKCAEGRW